MKKPQLKKNQPGSAPLPSSYFVGRRDAKGDLQPAFVISRRDNGGIAITQLQDSITSIEKNRLFAHFGQRHDVVKGGETEDGVDVTWVEKDVPSGSHEHFVQAVDTLPGHFQKMSKQLWDARKKK